MSSRVNKKINAHYKIATSPNLIILITFQNVQYLHFLIFDYYNYVTGNSNINTGISIANLHWIFTKYHPEKRNFNKDNGCS